MIKKLQQTGLPVAIVLTKSDLLSEEEVRTLREVIQHSLPQVDVFETTIKEEFKYLQLAELCQWSVDNLPAGLKISFISAQCKNINLKRAAAKKIILQHTTGAGFVGMTPIPFADAPLLVSNQAGMIARILFIYDMGSFAGQVKDLLGTVVISSMVSGGGVWIAAELLKIIPYIGTVVGGVINGTVAVTITYAIGTSVSELCAVFSEKVLKGDADKLKAFIEGIDTFFVDEVTKNFKKRSKR